MAIRNINYLKRNSRFPRLTIKGLTTSTANSQEQKFDWCDALLDAIIISGLTFFSTLGGGSVAGLSGMAGLKVATIAALIATIYLHKKDACPQREYSTSAEMTIHFL